jgi:predicted glycoside hydrolase/deacetylase ChbG (UPF0249 family)
MNYISKKELKKYIEKYPNMNFGIHFNLTYGKPVSKKLKTCVDDNGYFYKDNIKKQLNEKEVEDEIKAQFFKFLESSHKPTHIDSHHYIQKKEEVYKVIEKISLEYKIPIRNTENKLLDDFHKFFFSSGFYKDTVSLDTLYTIIKNAKIPLEIMCHPGYISKKLTKISTYNNKREDEIKVLISSDLKEYCLKENIKLSNYSND